MALSPQPGINGAINHLTPSSSNGHSTPRSPGARPMLPNRSVTSGTIEDAYVSFILCCNPAVPLDVDTTSLRESFRSPPKSEGKSFSTFTLYELIAKLHAKEIKTWAELALKLGVEPPDHEKGQSSQKIQQYAVRLKRWMHSMHVNAFFDYLLDNPHPYWTQIPTDRNPVAEEGRDGVAAEDDMALRALLPHIRPRRGRKRPEEDSLSKSPSQRPRLDSPAFNVEAQHRQDGLNAWSANPEARQAFVFPPMDPRSSILPAHDPAYAWQGEIQREPMSAYPQSAITPSTRGSFWPDSAEPRSAISPKSKPLGRRHGAKAVSSAWRSIGGSASGKARGRPPLNRDGETPTSAYPQERNFTPNTTFDHQSYSSTPTPIHMPPPEMEQIARASEPSFQNVPRPHRPGRLSLQVPDRPSGPVRLATPPAPVVMVNGQSTVDGNEHAQIKDSTASAEEQRSQTDRGYVMFNDRSSAMYLNKDNPSRLDDLDIDGPDTTSHDEVEITLVTTLVECVWFDPHGVPGPRPSVAEVVAVVRAVIRSISDQALTREAFLINLAALIGGHFMIQPDKEVHRLEIGPDYTKYLCKWTLRYGAISSTFTLTETVPHSKWKPGHQNTNEPPARDAMPADGIPAAEYWQKQYQSLAVTSIRRLNSMTTAKVNALRFLKESPDIDASRTL
ncbi:hypothetical protein GGR57DRAFT_81942 [Xylariaceae sp. FL1272]|nr:hypothetical protein GGR57DRAFT_81942 [Xylariaceae sp. FL1272]